MVSETLAVSMFNGGKPTLTPPTGGLSSLHSHRVTRKQQRLRFSIFGLATHRNELYMSTASEGVKDDRDEMHGDLKESVIRGERERHGTSGGIQMKQHAGHRSENVMEPYSLHPHSWGKKRPSRCLGGPGAVTGDMA